MDGLKLKEDGCIYNLYLHLMISEKRCKAKRTNLTGLIKCLELQWNNSLNNQIFGKLFKQINLKANLIMLIKY